MGGYHNRDDAGKKENNVRTDERNGVCNAESGADRLCIAENKDIGRNVTYIAEILLDALCQNYAFRAVQNLVAYNSAVFLTYQAVFNITVDLAGEYLISARTESEKIAVVFGQADDDVKLVRSGFIAYDRLKVIDIRFAVRIQTAGGYDIFYERGGVDTFGGFVSAVENRSEYCPRKHKDCHCAQCEEDECDPDPESYAAEIFFHFRLIFLL